MHEALKLMAESTVPLMQCIATLELVISKVKDAELTIASSDDAIRGVLPGEVVDVVAIRHLMSTGHLELTRFCLGSLTGLRRSINSVVNDLGRALPALQ